MHVNNPMLAERLVGGLVIGTISWRNHTHFPFFLSFFPLSSHSHLQWRKECLCVCSQPCYVSLVLCAWYGTTTFVKRNLSFFPWYDLPCLLSYDIVHGCVNVIWKRESKKERKNEITQLFLFFFLHSLSQLSRPCKGKVLNNLHLHSFLPLTTKSYHESRPNSTQVKSLVPVFHPISRLGVQRLFLSA